MENTLKNKVLAGVLGGAIGLAGFIGCQGESIRFTDRGREITLEVNGETILRYTAIPGDCFTFSNDYRHIISDEGCKGTVDVAYPLKPNQTKALKLLFKESEENI